jgi:hypothetical protein
MKGSFRGIYDAFDGFKKMMEEALDGAVDKDIPPGATVVTAKRPPPFLPFANPFLPGNQNAKTHKLGCAFHFLFRFLPGVIFGIRGIPQHFRIPSEHTSELNHSRARLIWSVIPDSGFPAGIPEGRIRNTYVLVGI